MTPYHSKHAAYELTRQNSSDSVAKLGASLFNATVDLNPHQLDAAVFAFRSPLSRGAILADEVGLGKTIEAGIIMSQLWAERKRKILVICPTILRKQWAQELSDKFYIPSWVVDAREFKLHEKQGAREPLVKNDSVTICSFHFAFAKEAEFAGTRWDLVVIDEAHRLRNVYKPGNRIASAMKRAVRGRPTLLLTATPLQNSLLELFGLVSFLDEHLFGDINAFRARYMRGPVEERELHELRQRLKPICQRTLRRQVVEYVRFTNRIPITQDFTPTAEEQKVYDQVSAYLQREKLNALPKSQRKLMTLVLRKLLASSTYAIAGTMHSLVARLRNLEREAANKQTLSEELDEDFETLDEIEDEWDEESEYDELSDEAKAKIDDIADISAELAEVAEYAELASSITTNAKGEALLTALELGFQKLAELGAARKAVIFTESRRTQAYLYDLLSNNGHAGRVLTINGTNMDDRSGEIYRNWLTRHAGEDVTIGNKTVNLRAALVEHFRDDADILIATEAAAEGVNLQFCSFVVNYDLPWNPQRIEQRIGRCHRYGQKHDVVVVNFLNRGNAADQRVFELLSEKFRLFDGVFGSSDEVLGALESGVDFERRIANIYQNCRTTDEIDDAFKELRSELEIPINERMTDTRRALLENFDEDVHLRLRTSYNESSAYLSNLERSLWELTKFELTEGEEELATFDEDKFEFNLQKSPDNLFGTQTGVYRFVTRKHDLAGAHPYRLGDPLAEYLIARAKNRDLPVVEIRFDYSNHSAKIGLLEPFVGSAGWMKVARLKITALEEEDHLLYAIITDEPGEVLHPEFGEKLFRLAGVVTGETTRGGFLEFDLLKQLRVLEESTITEISNRNGQYFDEEIDKLDRWADDLKHGLETEIKDLDAQIRTLKKDSRLAGNLQAKIEMHRHLKDAESERSSKRRQLYEAQDQIDEQKEELISSVEAKLKQKTESEEIFTIRWQLV